MLIFYKAIDFSVLNAGFTIPIVHKEMLFSSLGFSLKRGDRKKVTILIGSEAFSADMVNIMFNEEKYPTHQDLLQIRYAKKSPLAQKLRETFSYTQQLIAQQMQLGKGTRLTGIPEKQKEFLAIYSSPIPDTLLFDCIVNGEFREETSELCSFGEVVAESILDGTDPHADILLKTRVCKIRKLTKTILNDLKIAYGYRCQICGECIGEKYGSNLIHAHHIDYFTKSINNDASNIMVVCPNHHGIIHDQNPVFDRRNKCFHYPNGYVEGLKLNMHL